MSEQRARYLHVVRSRPSTPPAGPSDASSRSEGTQQAEGAATVEDAARASAAVPAPPRLEDGASTALPDAEVSPPSAPLSQAIMYAVVGWLALCMERVAVAVDIQPIAERLYEVSAHFDAERTQGIILRVRLEVEPGLALRTTVEPVRP